MVGMGTPVAIGIWMAKMENVVVYDAVLLFLGHGWGITGPGGAPGSAGDIRVSTGAGEEPIIYV